MADERTERSGTPERFEGDLDSSIADRRIVHGIDFSGATNAGAKIHIASARVGSSTHIERCRSVASVLGTADRDAALSYLREFLASDPRAVCGLDFSFGLPRSITDAETWRAFIEAFAFENADGMVDRYVTRTREVTNGERTYLKRETDSEYGASSPYGFIVAAQTFYGISAVLRPLVLADRVSVLPMDSPADRPWLCESYPAATLRSLSLPDRKYKNENTPETRERRERIVAGLREAGVTFASEAIATDAVSDTEGDALDSIVAAVATARALRTGRLTDRSRLGDRGLLEGHIYA